MRARDRHATKAEPPARGLRKLEAGIPRQKGARVSVLVSRPFRLHEEGAPIRHVLIFDDHPATIRLLDDVDTAQRRKDKLATARYSALILLLLLVMFSLLL